LLADEADGGERRDAEVDLGLVVHEAEQDVDQVVPLQLRELDGGDGGDDHRREPARALVRGRERGEGLALDLGLGALVEREPARGVVLLPRDLLRTGV
jgi:hypothetical protein